MTSHFSIHGDPRWRRPTNKMAVVATVMLFMVTMTTASPFLSTLTGSSQKSHKSSQTFTSTRWLPTPMTYRDTWDYKSIPRDSIPTLVRNDTSGTDPRINGTSRGMIPKGVNGTRSRDDMHGATSRRLVWPFDSILPSLAAAYLATDGSTGDDASLAVDSQSTSSNSNGGGGHGGGGGNHGNTVLPQFVDKALRLFNLRQVALELETSVMSKVSCTACKAGAGLLQHYIRSGRSPQQIVSTIRQFCTALKIQSERVCDGISQLFGNEVIYVLERVDIGPDEICSFVIGDACGDVYNPYHEWSVSFPPVERPQFKPQQVPVDGAPSFKVLHISDTHYDPYYAEGSNADCSEPLCCRLTNGGAATPGAAAGKWGDYRKCDTPKRTVDHMLRHIVETHPDIDYILWTGDLPPHDVWNQTREENLKILRDTVRQMSEMFPGVPVFPALGNHESAPVNSFPPPYVDQPASAISWLYDELDEQWRRWLPASVSHTVRRGAFYSVLVRPGFRIVSLNMNYCNNKNWWLLLNSTDPATELQWLIYELQSAEFGGEKVHIIGHIPPGHADCLKVWSRNYYAIVARYAGTVTSQFFGHTHYDEFEVFYDTGDADVPVSVAYVGPSVSPYYDLNPGYRIYYVDGDHARTTRAVVDHESWIMNLKEANLYDYPIWYKLYTARSAYGMTSLRPQDWDRLIARMTSPDQEGTALFEQYYKHYWKNSPRRPQRCDVTGGCRARLLCDARSGRSHDRRSLCARVESRLNGLSDGSGGEGDGDGGGWRQWLYRGWSKSVSVLMSIPRYTVTQLPKYVIAGLTG